VIIIYKYIPPPPPNYKNKSKYMKKIQNNIYQIENTDVLMDNIGRYIVIEDYLDISISNKNKLINIPLIVFISEPENDKEEPSIPPAYGFKKIYLTTNLNELFILDHKLIVNYKNHLTNEVNINDHKSFNLFTHLYAFFYQNINLYTQKVNYRIQNINQNYIVKNS